MHTTRANTSHRAVVLQPSAALASAAAAGPATGPSAAAAAPAAQAEAAPKAQVQAPAAPGAPTDQPLEPDADVHLRWKLEPDFQLSFYKDLTKAKLSAFVVLTTMAGYAMAPGATSVASLVWTTVGTALCVASANSINLWVEAPYDAQMARTRNRVLVRQGMSPAHAFMAGTASGVTGVAMLYALVNPITAFLGGLNIIIYTCIYTPMKRTSIANTWAGSIVGAIPPMMGWAACTGGLELGAWVLGAILYAWQFPHFNALAWNLRPDYSKAGYRMMSVVDPGLNARVALRYSLVLFPLSYAVYALGIVTPWFLLDSSLVNGYMAWCAFRFWRDSTDGSARKLFFSSLVHLPLILALMMIHKAAVSAPAEELDAAAEGDADAEASVRPVQ
ncbi:Protoheme IX farnesyltransferase, mitochondrial [Polyrhizophydium stewartii]|uniref:Protoheme IX farnesyltransferase, mitochondrial n=1 Tax=Polyrhizophydium stewartii TaxID=2732419 RepID=A0ABR4N1R3_9FUNG